MMPARIWPPPPSSVSTSPKPTAWCVSKSGAVTYGIESKWEEAIDGLLATVATNYVHYPQDALTTSTITQTTKPISMLYVVYNRERTA